MSEEHSLGRHPALESPPARHSWRGRAARMLPRRLTRSQLITGLAVVLWAGLLLGTSITLWRDPGRGIFDVYRDATTHWWAAEPLYRPGMRAFVYLTSGPLIFTPFAALGQPLDDL